MNDLYRINAVTAGENAVTAQISLNAAHPLFLGHFPGQPVLPGVCMMEIIGDVAGTHLKKRLRIAGGPLIKFLHMVDPRYTADIETEMTLTGKDKNWVAEGRLKNTETVFVRFRLELTEVREPSAAVHEIS